MKKVTLLFLALMVIAAITKSQNQEIRQQKIITDPETGYSLIEQEGMPQLHSGGFSTGGTSRGLEINWQYTDPASVGSIVKVSSEAGNTFASWWLNDERISLYTNSATPQWEVPITSDWEWPIDMTEDGDWVVTGYSGIVQVFLSSSPVPYWERTFEGGINGVKISPDGDKVYIAENDRGGSGKAYVSCFIVGEQDPEWETSFQGDATNFAASGDRSTLVFAQYVGVNKIWVIDASDGSVIFDAYYKNQYPPALSYDGKIILNGDYSGYAYLYEYVESKGTYEEKWNFKVGGGGTSAWVVGMGVSADGNTVAVGTLVFLSGGYDGEIYLLNSWSPEPIWVFEHAGDEICSIDLSADGSLIAAAGYGPMDHSKPDFMLFRRESNTPIFTINTLGSFNTVDISDDGTLCAVTGKAVHARVMGSGGLLYNIDSDPGGGTIAGIVDLEQTTDDSGAKIEIPELENYFTYSSDDGSYSIKYIPEGTYSVNASKVGYYPETIENVVVTEGETTIVDFSLEMTGNPPYSLEATHGAGLFVGLSWSHANPGETEGFNIYRKKIPEDPFPEEPIAMVTPDILSYEDNDVLPLTNYYYAVTAILEEGVESPYSNTAEGWMCSGFVTDEISAYYGSTPVIDGTISPGEWDDAFKLDASDFLGKYDNTPNPVGSVTMYFKVNQDMSELFVACINENDNTLEDHDEVALYIDDNNDGTYPPSGDNSEGNYWAAYYQSGSVIKYRPIYNTGGVGEVFYLEDPQIVVSDETGVIVYEFMIPIGDDEDWKISPNEENQSGLFNFTLDDPSAFDGYWPCQNQQIFMPEGYGTITFGAEDEIPTSPETVEILWTWEPLIITLEWSQPLINDFDYFNIYYSENGPPFELLVSTIGNQIFYVPPEPEYTEFYITTVDQAGQESDPSEIVVFDPYVGIEESEVHTELNVYPSPTSGAVTVSFRLDGSSLTQVTIFDVQGKIVATLLNSELPAGEYSLVWDGKSALGDQLKNGIYFVQIFNSQMMVSKKLILLK